jgi:1D-myo-inositol-tetrakisphosphate 5-kinase/inositol-polyphosphate multikinase
VVAFILLLRSLAYSWGILFLSVKYFALENITKRFQYPCILDIKIGAQTYDPLAPPDKMAREDAKCPWKKNTGFSLTGLKVRAID